MNQRVYSLDIIRILACFMVVLMHSPLPAENANGPFLVCLSFLTAPCIGLFFMVSGALLLPVKTDYLTFIRRRFSKIVVPTIIWSLIYICLRLYNSESEINILQSLASIPFSAQGEGVLWFMYTLAGLYLLAPILSAWIEKASKRDLEIVLLLWAVTLCYPILDFLVITNTSSAGILYYFTGYAGYFLLGYYLKKYPKSIPILLVWFISLFGIVLLYLLKYYQIVFDFYKLFWYESIFIASLAIAIWETISIFYSKSQDSYVSVGTSFKISTLSNLTFGVYLIHILIMRYWLWKQTWIIGISNYMIQTIVIAAITIIMSLIFCWIVSFLPYSRWIIASGNKSTIKKS